MLNITEQTEGYIERTFHDVTKLIIYRAFSLLEDFGVSFYEDKYLTITTRESTIDSNVKQDQFTNYLRADLLNIIIEHDVWLDVDQDPTLSELTSLVSFLYRVQHLEDYTPVSHILNSILDDRSKLIQLMRLVSNLDEFRLMSLIKGTTPELIASMTQLAKSKEDALEVTPIDRGWLNNCRKFSDFIDNSSCLGLTIYEMGYVNKTLTEVVSLLPYAIRTKLEENILRNKPQAALDILSLLIYTIDNYNDVLEKLDEHLYTFFEDLTEVSAIKPIITDMVSDFQSYLSVVKQGEVTS